MPPALKSPFWWTVAGLGLIFGLSTLQNRAHSARMASDTRKLTRSETLRRARAAAARRRRAEDKADYAIAVKRCADLDAGRTKLLSPDEVWKSLGL
ncbi:MAG: hypothetical protein H3C27_08520 [Opitutaceae bacterium]|nr:hypothetical protein [Opitutaceae bacterium]